MSRVYPNTVLQRAINATGHTCRTLWEIRGPEDTMIAWLTGYAVNGRVVIVQTLSDGGWEVYTASEVTGVQETMLDVLQRCGLGRG